jgi:glycosyltransferase involved in cell wall biosynthesis
LRVTLLNQCYPPDDAPTGRYFADLAAALAERGHEVRVVGYRWPYYALGGARGAELPQRLAAETARVVVERVGPRQWTHASVLGKTGAFAWYALAAMTRALRGPRPDVIIAGTSPPMLPVLAGWVSRFRGARLIVWSMDLHPEALVFDGRLREGGPPERLLRRWRDAVFRRATRVVAIGQCMAERLARAVPGAAVIAVPLWPLKTLDARAVSLVGGGVAGRLEVLYAGHFGVGHEVDTIAGALSELRDEDRVMVTFVTNALPEALAPFVASGRARTLPRQAEEAMPSLLAGADVHLVTLKDGAAGLMVPSKALSAFAAGKPVVFVGPAASEVARRVAESGAGVAVPCGDSRALLGAWRRLRDDLDARLEMGLRARALAAGPLNAQAGLAAWLSVVEG